MNRSVFAVLALVMAAGTTAQAGETTVVEGLTPRSVKTEAVKPAAAEEDSAKSDSEKAGAEKASGDFARRLFGRAVNGTDKSYACFTRQYDAAHLARHPHQKVGAMKLLVTAEILPEDQHLNYAFRLGVKFRDKPHEYSSGGECGHAQASEDNDGNEQLGCGVDCDGGGLNVAMKDANKSALVKIETIRIWRNTRSEDQDGRLEGGKDDRLFRLDRAPIEQCLSLANDRKERAAMRRQALSF